MREERQSVYGAGAEEIGDEADAVMRRLTIALAWRAARQSRDRVFGAHLFINPAWDILLTLFIDQLKGRTSAVTQVCQTSTAPITTALRWIAALEGEDLIRRIPDPRDRRRTFLALTPHGLEGMEKATDSAANSDAELGLGRLQLL